MRRGLLLGALALLVACAGTGPRVYREVGLLVDAMKSRGVECTGLEIERPPRADGAIHGGRCLVDGREAVDINIFGTPDALRGWIEAAATPVEGLEEERSLVSGPNWTIDPITAAVAKRIHDVMGGTIH